MNEYSPIVWEFDTPEDEAAYLEWSRAKVAASLADLRPPVGYYQVVAEIREIIARARTGEPC